MIHSFDTTIAKKTSMAAAVIYNNILFWCAKNKANNKNFHENNWWVYNSVDAWKELHDYLGESQIKTALKKLEEAGLIGSGNYNKSSYDRTKWFCIMHMEVLANGIDDNSQTIPDINPLEEEEVNSDNSKKETPIFINQIEFINHLRLQYKFIPINIKDCKYYFGDDGKLKQTDNNKSISVGLAKEIYKLLFKNQKIILKYLLNQNDIQ